MKFVVNTVRGRQLAWKQIGYGGFPSTHSSIVATTCVLVGLREGWQSPAFGLGLTLLLIVVLDATGLRRLVGLQAEALNELMEKSTGAPGQLRASVGHRWVEIAGGLVVGGVSGVVLDTFVR